MGLIVSKVKLGSAAVLPSIVNSVFSNKELKPFKGGLGLRILSTSKGLISDKEAIKDKIGGEVVCEVF